MDSSRDTDNDPGKPGFLYSAHELQPITSKEGPASAADSLLTQRADETFSGSRHATRPLRSPLSLGSLSEFFLDLAILLGAVYFLVFGTLVYKMDGQPADSERSQALLAASRYGPTIFPIVFTAIVAKALRSTAAFKLEQGANVMTIEHLLASRTVFNALKAPLSLRSFSVITPLLIVLWALSPLGGQASLRVIYTAGSTYNSTVAVSYLNFSSPFINEGAQSASASSLVQSNDIFISALISPADQKASSQDGYGNIKVPMIEYVSTAAAESEWITLDSKDIVFSSLSGLPYLGVPGAGTTRFNIESTYMNADCTLAHSLNNAGVIWAHNLSSSYYNGENYLMLWDPFSATFILPNETYGTQFLSVGGSEWCDTTTFTNASCTITSSYVELAVECTGSDCHSTAIRQSKRPHPAVNKVPIAGSTTDSTMWLSFFPDLINATYSEALCDAACCGSSLIEAYLLDPKAPESIASSQSLGSPPIWPIGDRLFSQRYSQLLNTYWIDSVAPTVLLGDFTIPDDSGYLADAYLVSNATGSVAVATEVIRCDQTWLVILILSSCVMLMVGMGGAVLNLLRRGPEILDSFSVLLRPHPSIGIVRGSSMESGEEQARRLRDLKVRLGDVRPEYDVGHVAIAPIGDARPVKRLKGARRYD